MNSFSSHRQFCPFFPAAMLFLLLCLTGCTGLSAGSSPAQKSSAAAASSDAGPASMTAAATETGETADGKTAAAKTEEAAGGKTAAATETGETADSKTAAAKTGETAGGKTAAAAKAEETAATAAATAEETTARETASGIASTVTTAAAGGTASAAETAAAATTAAAASPDDSGPRLLKYIDAWQEWHTMEVDPSVDSCAYDPDLFIEEDGRMTYADDRYEVLRGLDVSEHQGYIDWEAVAEAGYSFAFIRVGYRGYGADGILYEDRAAVDNLQRAKAAGLKVGTYVFSQALSEEEAREEARLALRVIQSSGVETDLPLMYDPELIKDDWGRANEISRDQVVLNTAAFQEEIAKEAGPDLKTDIYSNLPWEHHYFDAETMNRNEIWYADYEKKPQTPYHFTWWQYTNEGSVPGIEGRVDLNLWIR